MSYNFETETEKTGWNVEGQEALVQISDEQAYKDKQALKALIPKKNAVFYLGHYDPLDADVVVGHI